MALADPLPIPNLKHLGISATTWQRKAQLARKEAIVVTSQRGENGKIDVELGKFGRLPVSQSSRRRVRMGSSQFTGWDVLIIRTQEHLPRAAYVCLNFCRIDALDEVSTFTARAGRY